MTICSITPTAFNSQCKEHYIINRITY